MEKNLKQVNSSCIKIVLFGPESSGKTTLAKELSKYYNCLWVEEFARGYLQKKWDKEKKACELSDIMVIAEGQMRLENNIANKSTKIFFCDTDLLETMVYSQKYFDGYCDPKLKKYAIENSYSLYLLTDIDVPWEKDDLRDRPERRQEMFQAFKTTLVKNKKPFILVSGSLKQRLETCIFEINKLIKSQK